MALAVDQAGPVVLRADDFDFNYESGVRVVYGEVVNCIPFELTYFGTHDWNSSIAADGDADLDVPFGPTGGAFVGASLVEASYASELHSIELNILKHDCCNVTWISGIRYIDAEEDFLLRVSDPSAGLLAIGTDNRLLGLQVGADAQYGCGGWCVGVTTKAGAYLNFAERDVFLRDQGQAQTLTVDREANDTEFAFVAEAVFGISRHLGCGVKLRGGYQVMWMQGMALAPEQLGNTAGGAAFAPPALDTDESILYDGGYVGLEWHR